MTAEADREPSVPTPEAWDQAPRLSTVPGTWEPELISDGGGLPFSPARAVEPPRAIDPEDPAVAALLVQIDRGRQQAQPGRLLRPRVRPAPKPVTEKLTGWRELARTDAEVLFGRGHPPQLLTVAVRRGRRGRWEPLGASNSRPLRAVRDGVRASSWRLDPAGALASESSDLRVLVTEVTMASGTAVADRLLDPELCLDAERALLRIYVRPIEGYVGRTARHETPVIIRLPEPLGTRPVVDGGVWRRP